MLPHKVPLPFSVHPRQVNRTTVELVCDALNIAIQQRRPSPGLVVYSDRGNQYANHTEVWNDIADYIVSFYNCERLKSALENFLPTVYERKMAMQ